MRNGEYAGYADFFDGTRTRFYRYVGSEGITSLLESERAVRELSSFLGSIGSKCRKLDTQYNWEQFCRTYDIAERMVRHGLNFQDAFIEVESRFSEAQAFEKLNRFLQKVEEIRHEMLASNSIEIPSTIAPKTKTKRILK